MSTELAFELLPSPHMDEIDQLLDESSPTDRQAEEQEQLVQI